MKATRLWRSTRVFAPRVKMTPFLPVSDKPVPAVIVCPGGSYFWLDLEYEGMRVCEWLRDNGIAAFLLEYRTGGWFNFTFYTRALYGGHRHPMMMEDIQMAIRTVRLGAKKYNVNPFKLGCLGFSAGGHLSLAAAEHYDTDFLAPHGFVAGVSLRPDFVAAIYPVVSMTAPCTHTRSRRGLLGEWQCNNPQLRDLFSLERHVSADMPPVFLLNCVDDPIVDYHNSELLDAALTAAGVQHTYIQYERGGHGFGVNPSKFTDETAGWQAAFIDWLKCRF